MPHQHVRIAVTGAARPGFERVPARHVEAADWELLGSPLYATGVAAADVIRVTNTKSNQTVLAEIIDSRTVRVAAPEQVSSR